MEKSKKLQYGAFGDLPCSVFSFQFTTNLKLIFSSIYTKKAPVQSFFNTIQFSLRSLLSLPVSYAVDLHRKPVLPFPDRL